MLLHCKQMLNVWKHCLSHTQFLYSLYSLSLSLCRSFISSELSRLCWNHRLLLRRDQSHPSLLRMRGVHLSPRLTICWTLIRFCWPWLTTSCSWTPQSSAEDCLRISPARRTRSGSDTHCSGFLHDRVQEVQISVCWYKCWGNCFETSLPSYSLLCISYTVDHNNSLFTSSLNWLEQWVFSVCFVLTSLGLCF